MKNLAVALLLTSLANYSCKSVLPNIFEKKTPHEQYADELDDSGLENTPEGRQWLDASQKALEKPQTISLPYSQQGYFHADKARAMALEFKAKPGQRLIFTIHKKQAPLTIYADLFQSNGIAATHLLAADTTANSFTLDVEQTGTYIVRLQPKLFQSGPYSLSVDIAPSLGFPVQGSKARIGSFWGDARDGGKRKHEGLDIFAPKRTPVLAAADGYVTGVKEGGIGGKTVWMKPGDKNLYLYYAHLDKQLVQQGQYVKKGEVIGLVGNTGNARHTPAHLHFGVYTHNGPIDALPFIDRMEKKAPDVSSKNLKEYAKLARTFKTNKGVMVKANSIVIPLAVNAKNYLAELEDGSMIEIPLSHIKSTGRTVTQNSAVANTQPERSQKS